MPCWGLYLKYSLMNKHVNTIIEKVNDQLEAIELEEEASLRKAKKQFCC